MSEWVPLMRSELARGYTVEVELDGDVVTESCLDLLREGLKIYRAKHGADPVRLEVGPRIAMKLGQELADLNEKCGVDSKFVRRKNQGEPLLQNGDEILGVRVELTPDNPVGDQL